MGRPIKCSCIGDIFSPYCRVHMETVPATGVYWGPWEKASRRRRAVLVWMLWNNTWCNTGTPMWAMREHYERLLARYTHKEA